MCSNQLCISVLYRGSLHGLPVVEGVVAALGVPEDRLARLELVDGDDLPEVLVQRVDDGHLVRGELKVVDLQVVQELGFDDALKKQAIFVGNFLMSSCNFITYFLELGSLGHTQNQDSVSFPE